MMYEDTRWKLLYNKAFKSDSQRFAFSVQGWVSCLRRNGLGWMVALLTP